MFSLDEANVAIRAIQGGKTAHELESGSLYFKQEGRSTEETVKSLVEAALCFANAQGGAVVLGVANKVGGSAAFTGTALSADILKRRIYELTRPPLLVDAQGIRVEGKDLIVLLIPQSAEVHADQKGRAPHRVGTECHPMAPADVARLREERAGFDWTAQEGTRAIEEISPEALTAVRHHLATLTDRRRDLATLTTPDLLRALGLLSVRGRMLRAGEILLCDPLEGKGPAIVYQFRLTPGGEPKRIERLASPVVNAFQRVMALVQDRQNITTAMLPSGQLLNIEDFPGLAVREALSNAIIHRDWRIPASITLEQSASSLIVVSPGPLVSGVTPTNILTHPSRPRNPALAQAFRLLGFAEVVGRGVDRMYREMIRSGRDIPRIESTPDDVRVTLVGGAPNTSIARFVAQLPEEERDDTDTMLVLFTLCSKRTITAVKLAPILQKTMDEAEAVLRRLAHDSLAIVEPTRQTARYRQWTCRLRGEVLKALGSAVLYHRRTLDDIDRKVITHVQEYGKITNRTIQNNFDVDVQRAKGILSDLVGREILVKTSERSRGPGIEYGPGSKFPRSRKR